VASLTKLGSAIVKPLVKPYSALAAGDTETVRELRKELALAVKALHVYQIKETAQSLQDRSAEVAAQRASGSVEQWTNAIMLEGGANISAMPTSEYAPSPRALDPEVERHNAVAFVEPAAKEEPLDQDIAMADSTAMADSSVPRPPLTKAPPPPPGLAPSVQVRKVPAKEEAAAASVAAASMATTIPVAHNDAVAALEDVAAIADSMARNDNIAALGTMERFIGVLDRASTSEYDENIDYGGTNGLRDDPMDVADSPAGASAVEDTTMYTEVTSASPLNSWTDLEAVRPGTGSEFEAPTMSDIPYAVTQQVLEDEHRVRGLIPPPSANADIV
jgi:hypothetical protein